MAETTMAFPERKTDSMLNGSTNDFVDDVEKQARLADGQNISTAHRGNGKTLSEILSEPDPGEKYLIKPLLSRGDKGYIVSSYKMGKTLFLTQLTLCLAMGKAFLGMDVQKPAKVLYIRFELKDHRFKKRLHSMIDGLGGISDVKVEPIFELTRGFNLISQKDFNWVVELIRKHRAEVLVFDPLYKMVQLDLKDTANAMPLIRRFDTLIEMFPDLLIVVAHHLRKQTGDDRDSWDQTYGPMFFFADMDFEIRLKAKHTTDPMFTLDHISNDLPVESFNFKRNPETLLYYVVNPETDHIEEIVEHVRTYKTNKTALKDWMIDSFGFSRRDADDVVDRLLTEKKMVWEGSRTRGCFVVPEGE